MKYSQLFGKTAKISKEFDSVNATLLIKAGFVEQVMAGVYAYLPLGQRVLSKIERIVREEMDKIGQEVFLPAIVPTSIWEATNRINSVDVLFKVVPANKESKERNDSEYILNSTHEDTITPIAKKHNFSYKDLPFALYQIQTKFRNEARPKSGILRGREFRMKDLYSFHADKDDLLKFYETAKKAYLDTYSRLGLGNDIVVAAASGGDFTENFSHEFQVPCEAGEDTIYKHKKTGECFNKEVMEGKDLSEYEEFSACEVGNIFPLEIKFSQACGYTYADEKGKEKLVYMGSYGIGTTRVMGVIVEKFHDERGILWPKEIAPFSVHLVSLPGGEEKAKALYEKLEKENVEVLWDDREISAGEKFADADLIGIPVRLVVSAKTGDKVEIKERNSSESELVSVDEVMLRIR